MPPRWVQVVSLALAGVACASCGEETSKADDDDGHGSNTAGAPDGWILGGCGTCVSDACAAARAACESEIECAAHVTCLFDCPADAFGNAEPACEAGCGRPQAESGAQLLAAFDACRADAPCPCREGGGTCPHPVACQQCPGGSTNPVACSACIENACCDTDAACSANASCIGMKVCLSKCTGSPASFWECEMACADGHAEGFSIYVAHEGCAQYHCIGQCSTNSVAVVCANCQNSECGAAKLACQADADCTRILGCSAQCPAGEYAACINACADQYPAAKAKYEAMLACYVVSCSGSC